MDQTTGGLSAREVKDYEINDTAVDRELDDAVERPCPKLNASRVPLPLQAADLDAAATRRRASEFLS